MQKLISWKYSFKKLNEEYELAGKKKQALDNLLGAGKISESTHSLFDKEIEDALAEIENQRKILLDKMGSKTDELEGQIRTLEVLFADFEIQHVTGEIDDVSYQRETDLLSMGLETARHELDAVQQAVGQLTGVFSPKEMESPADTEPPAPEQSPTQPEVKLSEDPVPILNGEEAEPAQETIVEAISTRTEEAQQPEAEAEAKEEQEA